MKPPKVYTVPVDKNGNWLSYGGYGYELWEVEPFRAVMAIDHIYSGRSAKGLVLVDIATKKTYQMFMTDFVKAVKELTISRGVFPSLLWVPQKRGMNYGIRPLKEGE